MRVSAIICEYNPFHTGHKYQIDLAKKNFDAVICVMSGSFVQRGDVAVFDKWSRAKAAVLSGADLVLELPVRYSLSSAMDFAMGAMEIIEGTGICDGLVFGSECADIEKLSNAVDILSNETAEISAKIKSLLDEGMGYPMARKIAYDGLIDTTLLDSPNNILALEYLASIKKIGSKITPITHARTSGYFDNTSNDGFASATLLRKMISDGKNVSEFTPFDFSACERYDINKLTDILKYKLIKDGENAFSDIADCEIGLANRFLKFADESSFDDIIDKCTTKRYTRARLRRIALRYILGITGGYCSPSYIRVLGANETGRELLSKMKKSATLTMVTKVADFKQTSICEDILATDISTICANRDIKKGRDFYISPIML